MPCGTKKFVLRAFATQEIDVKNLAFGTLSRDEKLHLSIKFYAEIGGKIGRESEPK